MQVSIDDARITHEVEAKPLTLTINFRSPPPQFDTRDYSVEPLTCSEDDASWSMPLPPIHNPDIQTVKIEMTSKSELFTYDDEFEIVELASAIRQKFIAGVYCPVFSEISLKFLLTSDKLGAGKETLTVPIKPHQEAEEVV